MKILVDQNISFRLLPHLHPIFKDIYHVKDLDLINAHDFEIYMYGRQYAFDAILTLDEDFFNIQLEHGIPPKIIWLRVGNCSTTALARIILEHVDDIQDFISDTQHDCLEIYGNPDNFRH